jgi:hypothetical protein
VGFDSESCLSFLFKVVIWYVNLIAQNTLFLEIKTPVENIFIDSTLNLNRDFMAGQQGNRVGR